MGVSHVASNTATSGSLSVTVTIPSSTQAGDLLLASVSCWTDQAVPVAPTGWTEITNRSSGSGTSGIRTVMFWKAAVSGDAGTDVTFSGSGSTGRMVATMSAYRGVDTSAPVETSATGVLSSGTSVSLPEVTTTGTTTLVFVAAGNDATSGTTFSFSSPLTRRSTVDHFHAGHGTADLEDVVAGTYSGYVATASASQRWAVITAALVPANTPPNAPTGLSPSGTTLNRANTNRFSWTFSDPDAGDSQSKYDLRYRLTGATSWTTVTKSTPNQFHDFAGGTFAAGDYEWQVRTYDALGEVGPYSASAFFTAADAPAGPTITDPTAGQTISTETYTVGWSTPSQESYQVRTVADDGFGAPDTSTVYTDSGEVVSTSARSLTVTFDTNGRDEHVQVRVKDGGLWSVWSSVNVTVSYTTPATPTVAVDDTSISGAITVQATHPAPSGSQPTVTSVDIHRREVTDTGDGIRISATEPPTVIYVDWAVASGVSYAYRVRAIGDNGTSSWSAWSEESSDIDVFYGGGYA